MWNAEYLCVFVYRVVQMVPSCRLKISVLMTTGKQSVILQVNIVCDTLHYISVFNAQFHI